MINFVLVTGVFFLIFILAGNHTVLSEHDWDVKPYDMRVLGKFFNKSCKPPDNPNHQLNIALVNPTFTSAAYNHAFYDFYKKYNSEIYGGENITTNLDLLTGKIPRMTTSTNLTRFVQVLPGNIEQLLPEAKICILSDADLHKGSIFYTKDTLPSQPTNLYDIIMIFHEEYVTNEIYNNLKKFVYNGGTLMALSGNPFYAQVKYNDRNQTVILIDGHGASFDGKTATKGTGK